MYLLEETEEARYMRENVIRLLESEDLANFYLAINLIKGGGMHTSFFCASVKKSVQYKLLGDFFETEYNYLDFEKLSKFHKFPYLKFLSVDIEIIEYHFSEDAVYLCVPFFREIFLTTQINTIILRSPTKHLNISKYLEILKGNRDFLAYSMNGSEFFITLTKLRNPPLFNGINYLNNL